MNNLTFPKLLALVSTPGGQRVKCEVEMILSPFQLMPMYQARAIEGHPFDGQRKVIVPFHRLTLISKVGNQ